MLNTNMYLRNLSLVFLSLTLCIVPSKADLDEDVRKGLLDFALKIGKDLYQNAGAEENVLVSQSNIYKTLSSLYLAADGTTLNELATFMGLPKDSVRETFENIGELVRSLGVWILSGPPAPGYVGRYVHFHVANGDVAFVDKKVQLKANFEELFRNYSRITNLDFDNQTTATDAISRDVIADGHTVPMGIIPELHSLILSSTRAFFVNYVDAVLQWEKEFPKNETRVEKFNVGTKQIDVKMMHSKGKVQFYKSSTLKYSALGIPHIGSGYYTTYIILPETDQDMKTLVQQFTAKDFEEITRSSSTVEMDYCLPLTKLKWSRSFKDILKTNVPSVFHNSNFNNMITNPESFEVLLNHAAEYELYEDGSRIVATTTAGLYNKISESVSAPASSKNDFVANKPFLLYVVSRSASVPVIMFSALVQNPASVN